ncbi:MAG: M12 family metallo-peptidase, partial [Planctomycetota bacterium]
MNLQRMRMSATMCIGLVACAAAWVAQAADDDGSSVRPHPYPLIHIVKAWYSGLGPHPKDTYSLSHDTYHRMKTRVGPWNLSIPLDGDEGVLAKVSRFEVIAPGARFISATTNGGVPRLVPDVILLRGHLVGEPSSRVFLGFGAEGIVSGYITRADGRRFVVSSDSRNRMTDGIPMLIREQKPNGGLPDFPEFCGLRTDGLKIQVSGSSTRSVPLLGGPRIAFVAIDTDSYYLQLFEGNDAAAQAYIVQVIGAVSDIYERDMDIKLQLSFVRTWPGGGEPFNAGDLFGFANYWTANENMTGLHVVQMFSGRRDMGYGGIAYLTSPCNGDAFSIAGYLNGSFPSPVDDADLGNWDIVVVAHEMGHNMGTLHTHDYDPPIDQCAFGTWARSDIMSYCHTTAGGMLNIDPRFHWRVQDTIVSTVEGGGCLWLDCNANGVNDATDIALS